MTVLFSNDFPSGTTPKQWFCVYSQFKNEKHVLLEWVHHYFQEGADHIILVDNASDDGYDVTALQTIPNLTLVYTDLRYRQTDMARFIFDQWVTPHFTWAINLDMDEFLYARKYPSISDYLRKQSLQNPSLKAVVVPWKSFGSSGHITQPNSVIDGFLYRDFDFPCSVNTNLVKTLFQPHYYTLHAHTPRVKEERFETYPHVIMEGLHKKFLENYRMWYTFEKKILDLPSAHLHLNHYQVQSLDYWTRVKMTRGDADVDHWDHIRDRNVFTDRDNNRILDDELSQKKKLKKPNLLLFHDPNHHRKEKEWRQRYGNTVNKLFFVVADPPYHKVIEQYLLLGGPDNILVVCPALGENMNQLDFVLCRTLVTGNPVYPEPLEGFPVPSPHIFAISLHDATEVKRDEMCRIPYDEKIW